MKEPDEEWINIGIYRVQAHEEKTAGIFMESGRHGAIIMEKYHSKGLNCHVAATIGIDPLLFCSSLSRLQYGKSEYDARSNLVYELVRVRFRVVRKREVEQCARRVVGSFRCIVGSNTLFHT